MFNPHHPLRKDEIFWNGSMEEEWFEGNWLTGNAGTRELADLSPRGSASEHCSGYNVQTGSGTSYTKKMFQLYIRRLLPQRFLNGRGFPVGTVYPYKKIHLL